MGVCVEVEMLSSPCRKPVRAHPFVKQIPLRIVTACNKSCGRLLGGCIHYEGCRDTEKLNCIESIVDIAMRRTIAPPVS